MYYYCVNKTTVLNKSLEVGLQEYFKAQVICYFRVCHFP